MLKKQNRLTTSYEFNKVRRLGEKLTHPLFIIYSLNIRDYTGPTKIGVVVTKKFHKNAVKRNRVKRVFRELVRANLTKFKNGFWIVIHPRFDTLEKGYEEINTEFIKALQEVPFAH